MRIAIAILALCSFLLMESPARACGPATHAREAGMVFDSVVQNFPEWAAISEVPDARAWIQFGAMAPDFQNATSLLKFGHSSALSLHLLEKASEVEPEYRWFALGHLAHNASDNSCESFFTGSLFGSAPLGMFDFMEDDRGALGESEDIVEAFGDAITGDWDAMVDVMYDFWLGGEEEKERAYDVFLWYCEIGAAYHGKDTDCQEAFDDFSDKFVSIEKYIGGFDRETAKELVHNLLDIPLVDLADLFLSGTIQAVLGDAIEMPPTPWAHEELERFKNSVLVDLDFWDVYFEHFGFLGPAWTIDRLLEGASISWPTWDPDAMICGNIQSMLQFLPEEYDVTPGLLVDDVQWLDADGKKVSKVKAGKEGDEFLARVRFFAALPFEGTVIGRVRRDRPGFDQTGDDVLGEAAISVSLDPFQYVWEARTEIEVPFTADTADALGFYLELVVSGASGPTFTTSWDRIWTLDSLELDRAVYTENFGTYGHWPPSLPVEKPESDSAVLFVKVRIAPAGGPILSAAATVIEEDSTDVTGPNGIAVFSDLSADEWSIDVTVDGYRSPGPMVVFLPSFVQTWVDFPMHPVPDVQVPGQYWPGGSCLSFSWDVGPFGDQVAEFIAWAEVKSRLDPGQLVKTDLEGSGMVCFGPHLQDGDSLTVGIQARYVDGSLGVEAFSPEVLIDGSPPIVTRLESAIPQDVPCLDHPDQIAFQPPLDVTVSFEEPHSPLTAVQWKMDDGDWFEPEWTIQAAGDVSGQVVFRLETSGLETGGVLSVRLTNAAGLSVNVAAAGLPRWEASNLCPEAEPAGSDAGSPPEMAPDNERAVGTTCSTALKVRNPSGNLLLPFVLLAWILLRRSLSAKKSTH